jgi:hypothetical protein
MMRIEPIMIDRVEEVFLSGVLPSMGRRSQPTALARELPWVDGRRDSHELTIASGTDLRSRSALRREAVNASVLN